MKKYVVSGVPKFHSTSVNVVSPCGVKSWGRRGTYKSSGTQGVTVRFDPGRVMRSFEESQDPNRGDSRPVILNGRLVT